MSRTQSSHRRWFLKAAAASLLAVPPPRSARAATLSPEEFRKRLRGPILSMPTVYTKDFKVDHQGIKNQIELAAKKGVKVFALTSGNNQYDRLTYQEVRALTNTMVETVAGRGVTIAAVGPWWTGQCEDYAHYAKSLGADCVQVQLPRHGSQDALYEHFRKIAKAGGDIALGMQGQVPLAALKQIVTIEQVSAYKEEYPQKYSMEVFKLYGDRLNIFAGGQKSRFLMYQPFGMQAYYSTFSTFAPQVAMRFWGAIENGDVEAARKIVLDYDVPFFLKWSHAFWRATLEHFGVAQRWLRPPEKSFTDAQVRELRTFYAEIGLG